MRGAQRDAGHETRVVEREDHDRTVQLGRIDTIVARRIRHGHRGIRSHGVLIFPRVSRAGVVLGGARGDGALVSRNQPVRFYRQQVASVGLQLGVQHYSQVYVFLQPQALAEFVANPSGWNVGADATVAVAYAAGHDGVDTTQLNRPVVVFTFDNAGLMAGITLSATQIFPKP